MDGACKNERCKFIENNIEIRLAVQEERTGSLKQDVQEIKDTLKDQKNRQNATLLGVIISVGLAIFQSILR